MTDETGDAVASVETVTPSPLPATGARLLRRWWPELVLLLLYAVLLLVLRPPDPFEWDEVLYLRALDHYDVSIHSPHPPGAPAYVAAGWLLRLVVRSGQIAYQLLSVLAGLASLVLLWRLAYRELPRRGAALAATVVLAIMPGFLFYANVGMTDVPAIAGTLGTILVALYALDEPRLLWAASLSGAVTLAIRPNMLLALAPAGLYLLVAAVRRREWRRLGIALAVGVAVSLAFWLPAILLTGWESYWTTIRLHSAYVAQQDGQFAFPRAATRALVKHWLVDPLGKKELALPFYLLVASGAVAWWRAGSRRLVLLAGSSAAVFMAGTVCTLNMLWGPRYGLPMLPFLALLAGGNLLWPARAARVGVAAAGAVWAGILVGWSEEPMLQRLRPSPVWSSLEYVRAHYDPRTTAVLHGGAITPHAEYVLGRAGFEVDDDLDDKAFAAALAAGKVPVYVGQVPVAGMVTEHEESFDEPRVLQLAFGRYERCLVQRLADPAAPRFGTTFEVREDGWLVWGKGVIDAAPGGPGYAGQICVKEGRATVSSWGLGARSVGPGECAPVLLQPGQARRATVSTRNEWVLLEPVELTPLAGPALSWLPRGTKAVEQLEAGDTFVIPAAARASGVGGAAWRTSLLLANNSYDDARAVVTMLPAGVASPLARAAAHPLLAGAYLRLEDVITADGIYPAGHDVIGALLVSVTDPSGRPLADPAAVRVEARTYDANAAAEAEKAGGAMPLLPVADGLVAGEVVRVALGPEAAAARVSVGAVALGHADAEIELAIEGPRFDIVVGEAMRVKAPGQSQRRLPVLAGTTAARLKVLRAPSGTRVFPYVSVVDNATGVTRYLVARTSTGAQGAPLPSLPIAAVLAPPEKR